MTTSGRTRRGRIGWIAALVLLVAAIGAGLTWAAGDDDDTAAAGERPAATTTSVATTTTTRAVRESPVLADRVRRTPPSTAARRAPAPLPVPEPPPDDPYADVPVERIGTIEIPKIGLVHDVYEGIWLTVLDHGPGHWPGSAMPGQRGNTVFPGHRVTHSHPFRWIDRLVPGDEVIFTMADGRFVYRVTDTKIVVPTDLWVVDQTPTPTMTIIACHPPGSARERIVVTGSLERPGRRTPPA